MSENRTPSLVETAGRKPKKVVTGKMDADLLDRAKAVAYWTPGLTLSALVEASVRAYLEEWERKNGTPSPAPGPLRNGRPLTLKGLR